MKDKNPETISSHISSQIHAPNVFECNINLSILDPFQKLIQHPFSSLEFDIVKPNWSSNIEWISANTVKTYNFFNYHFESSNISSHIKQYLDLNKKPIMYQGFIVSRSKCTKENFHEDWIETSSQAYTLMTPLTDNTKGFGLLYQDNNNQIQEYEYKIGKAIIFGDHFIHSTKPGSSKEPVMFLCFTFGTDKMQYWDQISQTAGVQGGLVRMPNGQWMKKSPSTKY